MTTRYVAVDWSGSLSGGGSQTWLAAVEEGALVTLQGPMTRAEIVDTLLDSLRRRTRLVAGLDFGFSFPAWYVGRLGCSTVSDLWELAAEAGESWLASCSPPLWGRPGRPRGPETQHRRTETEVSMRPKSVFQVGGAGSVGTGSIRGMPALRRLRQGGFGIWPFDDAAGSFVMEIYPRILTGPGPKSSWKWRSGYLDALGWPVDPAQRERSASTEDAFDATVSAFRMWRHAEELEDLESARDGTDLIEGRIWSPKALISSLATRKT